MNKHHQEILEEIKKEANKSHRRLVDNKYFGTKHFSYKLSQPQSRVIAKAWVKKHQTITPNEFLKLLNSLYQSQSHDERTFGGKLLEYLPDLRRQINPTSVDRWLTGAQGWWEVDSLCQMSFRAKEILENWDEWKKLLRKLVQDPDVHKRRASLVLLTKPVRESDDKRLADMAFENIEHLKGEKDILITKAISWLLRNLIKNHGVEVENFLNKNISTLPRIATRETKNKLNTGRK